MTEFEYRRPLGYSFKRRVVHYREFSASFGVECQTSQVCRQN